jgi:diaminopimelate decarboxylase
MEKMGIHGTDIFYTSNNTPKEDFELAIKLGATVNIDDFSQVATFLEALGDKDLERVAARYNPGGRKSGNNIIGQPKEAKFGMPLDSLIETFSYLKQRNINRFGLHAMVASNELDPRYFEDTAKLILQAVAEIERHVGIRFEFVNLGGGFGVNYKQDQRGFDLAAASELIAHQFEQAGRKDLQVFTENGRYITGPHGYLLTKVRYVMRKYKTFVGVDASMHNLMRPGMYGAYHQMTILGKENETVTRTYDVVGSLCENNDKFAIDRHLPWAEPGDLLVIHDAGAHGHAMGFNYNGMLRSAEVLLKNGEGTLIRRAESFEDYTRNVVWPK